MGRFTTGIVHEVEAGNTHGENIGHLLSGLFPGELAQLSEFRFLEPEVISGNSEATVPVGFGVGPRLPASGVFTLAVFRQDTGMDLDRDDVVGESPGVALVACTEGQGWNLHGTRCALGGREGPELAQAVLQH